MSGGAAATARHLPAVDKVLGWPAVVVLIEAHGRAAVLAAVRAELGARRALRKAAAAADAPAGAGAATDARPVADAAFADAAAGAADVSEAGQVHREHAADASAGREFAADGLADRGSDAGAQRRAATESESSITVAVCARVAAAQLPSLRKVFNLTGTVLHTNLGRAPLPTEALQAIARIAGGASNLEFDLETGRRGERDTHVEGWLRRLTGAAAATIVNNNAAALMLVLNTLGARREVLVSRGELVEIGGGFRLPQLIASAGCRLREVGTTNRTHIADYAEAIGPKTGLLLKVHTSNYEVRGYTAAASARELAALAQAHGLPFVVDLGSGALLDLARYGLPHESTPGEALEAGADLVTFSGDKLLGGPQAGLVVGRTDLVAALRRNPMKRAVRCDKLTLAALGAVLPLYADPERLRRRLPTLRLLTRAPSTIEAAAHRLLPVLAEWFGTAARVDIVAVQSQIGSGSLPADLLPSHALRITPATAKRSAGRALDALATTLRGLATPVVGRLANGALLLDLRCLERDDEAAFAALFQPSARP